MLYACIRTCWQIMCKNIVTRTRSLLRYQVFRCAGSCAITYEKAIGGSVTTEHEYFAKALELRDQCNVLVSCYMPDAPVILRTDTSTSHEKRVLQRRTCTFIAALFDRHANIWYCMSRCQHALHSAYDVHTIPDGHPDIWHHPQLSATVYLQSCSIMSAILAKSCSCSDRE